MGVIAILSRFSPMIGDLNLDATITESHEMSAEVTEFPIEEGSNISDNRRKNQRRLTLDGVVASAPTSLLQLTGPDAPLSVPEGFKALEELHEADELITVVTKLRTYENMLINSITVPRSNENGEAVFFSIEFTQAILVTTQRVKVTKAAEPAKAAAKVKQSSKPAKKVDVSQENLSALQQINRGIGVVAP